MDLREDRQVTNRLGNEMDKHCGNIQQTNIMVFHRCGSLSNQRCVTFTTSLLQYKRYLMDAGHN